MKTALALGTFDGVHIGHRAVLDLPEDCYKIAVIFPESPKSVMTGIRESIMTYKDKCRVIKNNDIDEIYPLDFLKIKEMTAPDFLDFINDKFKPSFISCGFNYRFGKDAAGSTEKLKQYCNEKGIELKCREPVCEDGKTVSSTEIRCLLKNGETEKANKLLSEPFSFTQKVIPGDKRGRTLGFPTINQRYPDGVVKLKFGVYKSLIRFDGQEYTGITNIGVRPTYLSEYVISETYIKDFSGDLYGKEITVIPQRFLRGEMKFSSAEQLKNQITADIDS